MTRLSACLFSHDQALCLSILALSGSLPVYSHMIRLSACLFLRYQAHGRLFSHYQAYCMSTYSHSQACCLSILSLLFLSILTFRLAAYLVALCHALFVHSQTRCHLFLHYQTCLPNLALRPRAYIFLHALSGLLTCVFSSSLPMYSQAHCLSTHKLTAYVFSGSLLMYS